MLRFAPILLAVVYAYAFWRFSVWRTVKDLNARSSELMDPALRGVTEVDSFKRREMKRLAQVNSSPHAIFLLDAKVGMEGTRALDNS